MALPPTSSKLSSDSNEVTTFKFDFPNFTGTHTGTLVSLNINSVAGGGTGLSSLTANNVILGNGSSSPTFVAPGATGNVLASNGTTWTSTTVTGITALGTQAQALNMGSQLINNVANPVSTQDAATKNYVDNAVAGINPAVAVQAATVSAANTSGFTYNNGVGGIGATFTGSTNTAITIDGYTFTALGQRLLVKNDAQSPSGAFNGIYYVTQIQTALLPPILTRALDYDQPSDINNTGAIPVINGTVNGTTQWVLTSLVNTVGTDPLTYTQFARNPADYLLKANNLSDVASPSTSFNNISPMTTGGDIIYGGASGAGTRLANGSSGQVLTSNGGTSAPSWQSISNGSLSYAQAYFTNASSWSTTSGSYSNGTNTGGNSLTVRQSSGIALTAGGSNVAGVTFTPPSVSAVYYIFARTNISSLSSGISGNAQLTDGTTVIDNSCTSFVNTSYFVPVSLAGIYVPATTSPVTIKIQIAAPNGGPTVLGGNVGSGIANSIEWTIIRIV